MDSLMTVHGLTESDADAATVDVDCMMHFRQARAKRLMISLDPLQYTGNPLMAATIFRQYLTTNTCLTVTHICLLISKQVSKQDNLYTAANKSLQATASIT